MRLAGRDYLCATAEALMASFGFLSINRVTSPFKAATTAVKQATHSADLLEDPRAASSISRAF